MNLIIYDDVFFINNIVEHYFNQQNKGKRLARNVDFARDALNNFFAEIDLPNKSERAGVIAHTRDFEGTTILKVFLFDNKVPSSYCFDDFYLYCLDEQTHSVKKVTNLTPELKSILENYRKYMAEHLSKIGFKFAKAYKVKLKDVEAGEISETPIVETQQNSKPIARKK